MRQPKQQPQPDKLGFFTPDAGAIKSEVSSLIAEMYRARLLRVAYPVPCYFD